MSSFREKLQSILQRYQWLEKQVSSPQDLSPSELGLLLKEYSHLKPIVEGIEMLFSLEKELEELKILEKDPEFLPIVEQEKPLLEATLQSQHLLVRTLLLPKDEDDTRNTLLEIRAGTGGEEASLFVADLFRMYKRYAEWKGWEVELMTLHETDQGGMREVSLSITGKDVFSCLKFEAGVHRVQRIPETEASGRVHTSTATVAVLPEAEEIDIHIEEKDLRIDVFRSSGPGGQSVNTTDSGVRVTHYPSGIVVQQQDEKSQYKNKAKAMKILRARLYEQKKAQQEAERSSSRQSQVGRGDRSERIRTYNFAQGRVTDHRIKLSLYKLPQILEGPALEEIIQALRAEDRAERLSHEEQL